MSDVVEKALGFWGLTGAAYRLVAARENAVYEVSAGPSRVALRLHRDGYRTDAELCCELDWMAEIAAGEISVPTPVRAQNGAFLCHVGGIQVDVLTWLTGRTMTDVLATLAPGERGALFFDLGREMARLHQVSDAWTVPSGFRRCHWNRDGLLGKAPLWDRFWENPALTPSERDLVETFRRSAAQRLDQIGGALDYGLVHGDLVPANVLVDEGALRVIDFDDGGFGYRLFDVATALLKHMDAPDYPQIRDRLIAGYHAIRPLDIGELDLFLALRAATYVGWNITRRGEPDGTARNRRFIAALNRTATRYLDRQA